MFLRLATPGFDRRAGPCLLLLLAVATCFGAQSTQRELDTPEKVLVSITNRNGRISVTASENQKKVSVEATSNGAPVTSDDVQTTVKGGNVQIDVRARRDSDRINLIVRVPSRSRVRVSGQAGAVDIVGNFEFAEVQTNTGTIHADVPLDAVKYSFLWEASRPRYLSDVELPEMKEKAGGHFLLAGSLGAKVPKHKKHQKAATDNKEPDVESPSDTEKTEHPESPKLVRLDFRTQRGVILLNVDPSMVPSDLKERPLTEAAKAIVRSGDVALVDAIRKVSPKMFGDYATTLPPIERQPTLMRVPPPVQMVAAVAPQLMRVNASVTDRNGRALSDLHTSDFTVWENGI